MLRPTLTRQTRARMRPVRVSISTVSGAPLARRGRLDRQHPAVDVEVVLVLPAVDVEPLPEVALVVIQPDANQRNAEIGRALQMIAGEDAEAAGVDRQRLVQAELGGEVSHRPRAEHAGVLAAPGVLRLQVFAEPAVGVVDAPMEGELRRPRLELRRRHLLQQQDGIVVALAPAQRVELAEQADRLFVPAPPQVLGQREEALMHRGDEVSDRARLAHDRRQLRARRRQHAEVVVAERPRLGRLHHQHALQHAAIDHRHADERAIADPRPPRGSI